MRRLTLLFVGLLVSTAAFAGTSTYVELGYITGGENGENGPAEENGFEAAGRFALSPKWYLGGALGTYDRSGFAENDYLNLNGGTIRALTEKTDAIVEFGFWSGDQDNDTGTDTDPMAVEVKFGLGTKIGEKFTGFGAISLVAGDLDTPPDDDLRNFVWSAGGAYAFNKHFSLSLQVIEGSNGVNGQSDVARIGGRWTF
ncbi:MAG TPA: hypothetical protein VFG08_00925 [Candidatus Polarisedimenticolia bacterium]|nr:hypothetical protein [Candidatus Polarisedimenticolia bacterium]